MTIKKRNSPKENSEKESKGDSSKENANNRELQPKPQSRRAGMSPTGWKDRGPRKGPPMC
eukprot:6181546-Pleurochrysis_carterae.AAC.2